MTKLRQENSVAQFAFCVRSSPTQQLCSVRELSSSAQFANSDVVSLGLGLGLGLVLGLGLGLGT